MPEKNDGPSYAAGLFEKAHEQITIMARIDAQVADLLMQRRSAQSKLTEAQTDINGEFNRLMRESDELPAKVLAEITGGHRQTAPEAHSRTKVTEPVA